MVWEACQTLNGSWGYDRDARLRDLIRAILRETDVPRLRLSSLEPWDLDVDFFSLWGDRRLLPHLHLPKVHIPHRHRGEEGAEETWDMEGDTEHEEDSRPARRWFGG